MLGEPDEAIIAYRNDGRVAHMKTCESLACDDLSLRKVSINSLDRALEYTEKICLSFDVELHSKRAMSARLIVSVLNSFGERLFASAISLDFIDDSMSSCATISWQSPAELLKDGNYDVTISVGIPGQQKLIHETVIASTHIVNSFTGSFYPDVARWPGAVLPRCNWIINEKDFAKL